MLNHRHFGGMLMGISIGIFSIYIILLFINEIWALIASMTIIISIISIMFFWLGFKVISTGMLTKEGEPTEKI